MGISLIELIDSAFLNPSSSKRDLTISKDTPFVSITFSNRVAGLESVFEAEDFWVEFDCFWPPPISSWPTMLILRKFLTHLTNALFSAVAARKLQAKL